MRWGSLKETQVGAVGMGKEQCHCHISPHLLVVHGADPALHIGDVSGGGHLQMAVKTTVKEERHLDDEVAVEEGGPLPDPPQSSATVAATISWGARRGRGSRSRRGGGAGAGGGGGAGAGRLAPIINIFLPIDSLTQ